MKISLKESLFSLVKNYFERKLTVHLFLHYLRKRFFRKGFDPEFILLRTADLTRIGFLDWFHARIEMGRVFCH